MSTFETHVPWTSEAMFTRTLLHISGQKASFHKVDPFHTVTLGVGKNFAAGALSILQQLCRGTSIEERLVELTTEYLEFCKDVLLFLLDWSCPQV